MDFGLLRMRRFTIPFTMENVHVILPWDSFFRHRIVAFLPFLLWSAWASGYHPSYVGIINKTPLKLVIYHVLFSLEFGEWGVTTLNYTVTCFFSVLLMVGSTDGVMLSSYLSSKLYFKFSFLKYISIYVYSNKHLSLNPSNATNY